MPYVPYRTRELITISVVALLVYVPALYRAVHAFFWRGSHYLAPIALSVFTVAVAALVPRWRWALWARGFLIFVEVGAVIAELRPPLSAQLALDLPALLLLLSPSMRSHVARYRLAPTAA